MLGALSCIFLMYYLAADTWWRFIGWLVLGLSIYLAYGYTRSAIGIRLGALTHSDWLKIAALGFLALAVGLFTVPHDIGVKGVLEAATTSEHEQHVRTLIGLLLIFLGLVLGIVGSVLVAKTTPPEDEADKGGSEG